MKELTYLHDVAPGVEEYEALFGPYEPDDIPYQLDIENMAEGPIVFCKEFGELASRCAVEGHKITARDYIDAFWLTNGIYSGYGVTTKDYDKFVAKVSKMDILL